MSGGCASGITLASSSRMRVLVADDDPITTTILGNALTRWGFAVTTVHRGDDAWRQISGPAPPPIAVLDWMMPGMEGIELCHRVRTTPRLSSTYIVMLTAKDSRADLIAGLDAGADDFMAKPVNLEELRARIRVAQRVARLQHNLSDAVRQLRRKRDDLAKLVDYDSLTGVYARTAWMQRAASEFSRARRHHLDLSVLMLDLDWFKQINDGFGHSVGDRVLQNVGHMLRQQCRTSDIVGRLGGEEFAIVLPETSATSAGRLATRLIGECRGIVRGDLPQDVRTSCSIGITELRPDDVRFEMLLQRADGALYLAKAGGRDQWTFAA
jgi:two-component system chemotaxis response regulator CheY